MRILGLILFVLVGTGCRLESPPAREIRGHTLDFGGVWHGTSASNAQRYCQHCHGANLEGGDHGEPSCTTCHGEVWLSRDPESSAAPADHTVLGGEFYHHPNRAAPLGTCDNAACHNQDLKGTHKVEPPGCLLCHAALWDQ